MWLMVMFDLPVLTKPERRAATKFRQWLLDEGYEMSQLSVYIRFCVGKEQVERRIRDIARTRPDRGKIHILSVTDKQFEAMTVFRDRAQGRGKSRPNQLELF